MNDEAEVDDNELDHEGLCDENDDDTNSKGWVTSAVDHMIIYFTRSVCVSCFV